MKKKYKKSKKKKKISKKSTKTKNFKKIKKKSKKVKKIRLTRKKRKTKSKVKNIKKEIFSTNKENQNNSLVLKLVKFQMALKPEFNFKFNFSLEKYIQGFFDKISETISSYKILKADEKRRIKIEKIENERNEKIELEKQKKYEQDLKIKMQEQALREEARLEKQRTKDIKLFLRKEQALLRIEQAENPNQEILPSNGLIIIFPAKRKHSVFYKGKKDRIIIGVNFYKI